MPFDFSSFGKRSTLEPTDRVNMRYPTKKSMNLLAPEQAQNDYRTAIVAGIILAILVLAFAKFAVIDRYGAITDKQAQLDSMRTELEQVQKSLEDYSAVEQEYRSYAGMGASTDGTPDALTMAQLVHDVLGSDAKMSSLTMSTTQLRVKLDGYSLKEIGELTEKFKKKDAVKKITVSTANTDSSDEKGVSTTLTISLVEDTSKASSPGNGKTQ